MHMCVISIDRYLCMRNPLATRAKQRCHIAPKIACVWVISLAAASPIIALSIVRPNELLSDQQCAIFNGYFLIFGSLAAFFVPLCIMAVAYSLTIHLLQRQAEKCSRQNGMRRTRSSRSTRKFFQRITTSHNHYSLVNGASREPRKDRSALEMTGYIRNMAKSQALLMKQITTRDAASSQADEKTEKQSKSDLRDRRDAHRVR